MKRLPGLVTALLALGLADLAEAKTAPPMPGQLPGMQVAVGECITGPQPPRKAPPNESNKGLFDTAAGALISAGVNLIGKALTEAGAAKTWTTTGARNFEPRSGQLPSCVLVVRGVFDATGRQTSGWTPPSPWPATLPATLAARGVWTGQQPDFLFEGQLIQSTDGRAYTIRPLAVTYQSPIGTRALRPGTDRYIALFFALTPPGTKATVDKAPASNVIIGKVPAGTSFPFALPPEGISSAYEPQWFSLSADDLKKALTVTSVLSETQDESSFLTFLGKIASDTKVQTAATTELSQILIPSVGKQAALDDEKASNTADNTAEEKMTTALNRLDACVAASGTAAIRTAAQQAKGALRDAKLADEGRRAPTGAVQDATIDRIDLQADSKQMQTACKDLVESLRKP